MQSGSSKKLRKLLEKIEPIDATVMEICGGHTNTIMRYGIRDLLPKGLKLISGPGCPVCVSSQYDIDCIIALAESGVKVATYGDMLRVPGSTRSLEDTGNVHEVYSAEEVLKLKDTVFFGVGFETTAPMSAFLLKKGVCVYSVHKLVPPVMKALLSDELKIDGFIDPGHVSTIIGTKPYEDIPVAQAIAGFTPEQVLRAVGALVRLIKAGKKNVVNEYPEAVREQGNPEARELLKEHFNVVNSTWRGLGEIDDSGLEVKNAILNAKLRYKDILKKVPKPKKTACRCGDVLRGLIEPTECPMYKNQCTPETPVGACMVSREGNCSIYYQYGK